MKPARLLRWWRFITWRPDPHTGWRRRLARHLEIEEQPGRTHCEPAERPRIRRIA